MRIIGLSPKGVFSGFETSFFGALRAQGAELEAVSIESPAFKVLCTVAAVHPVKRTWGLRRDRLYFLSPEGFRIKSGMAAAAVGRLQGRHDLIYQVGSLWNPIPRQGTSLPLVLQVDYTTVLANRRGAEWKVGNKRWLDFWLAAERRLYEEAAIVLTTTENARRSILDDYGIAPDHVVTVGAGVSPPYDGPENGGPENSGPEGCRFPDYDGRRILFVGKGFKGKGLDTLLAAFQRVREKIPGARLTVVGPTQPVSGDHVDYLGRIADRNAVRELYYRHAVFAMPSLFEPLGQVFLEAMACKLPCIGTTLDAMPEMILDGRTGYTIEPGNAEMLAGHLVRLLENPDLARQMGTAGYELLGERFTWRTVGDAIMRECRKTLTAEQRGQRKEA